MMHPNCHYDASEPPILDKIVVGWSGPVQLEWDDSLESAPALKSKIWIEMIQFESAPAHKSKIWTQKMWYYFRKRWNLNAKDARLFPETMLSSENRGHAVACYRISAHSSHVEVGAPAWCWLYYRCLSVYCIFVVLMWSIDEGWCVGWWVDACLAEENFCDLYRCQILHILKFSTYWTLVACVWLRPLQMKYYVYQWSSHLSTSGN